jgi:hypothetical protein
LTLPLTGPSTPRTAQHVGGLSSASSAVIARWMRPTRRVTLALVPTLGGPVPSMRLLTTLSCHSARRAESVTYAKTSSGGRAISMLEAIGATLPPPLARRRNHLAPRARVETHR